MNDYGIIILLVLAVIFGPPLVLVVIGLYQRKHNPSRSKTFFILAALYLLVGGGICATM
jgi:hypothetical protein